MFKFGYERLLEYQKQQEDVARRDYKESLDKLDAEKLKLEIMYKHHDKALDEIFFLKNQEGGSNVGKLVELDEFVDGQLKKIEKQKVIIINHTQIVEQKQEIFHLAAKERKILDKLKEKKHLEFKKLEKKKEAKQNDELVVTRYRSKT